MAEDVAEPRRERAEIRPFHDPDAMLDRFDARMDGGEVPPAVVDTQTDGFSEQPATFESDEDTVQAEPVETASSHAEAQDAQDDPDFEKALNEALHSKPEAGSVTPVELQETTAPEDAVTEQAEPAPAAAVSGTSIDDIEDIDEDVLRPIVARLIREELQGELGERITRNVRKLVRREILRAINAREFE